MIVAYSHPSFPPCFGSIFSEISLTVSRYIYRVVWIQKTRMDSTLVLLRLNCADYVSSSKTFSLFLLNNICGEGEGRVGNQ